MSLSTAPGTANVKGPHTQRSTTQWLAALDIGQQYALAPRQLFAAGHTSWTMAGMFYLTLYIALGIPAARARKQYWYVVMAMVPTLFALWVGASRVTNYAHNPTDVLAGGALGACVAWCMFQVHSAVLDVRAQWDSTDLLPDFQRESTSRLELSRVNADDSV